VKLADFNALCEREYAKDGGIVDQVSMSPEAAQELAHDIMAGDGVTAELPGHPGVTVAGARVAHLTNPAAEGVRVPVLVYHSDDFPVPTRARVLRWVDVGP
jgi:hypothetical protein